MTASHLMRGKWIQWNIGELADFCGGERTGHIDNREKRTLCIVTEKRGLIYLGLQERYIL